MSNLPELLSAQRTELQRLPMPVLFPKDYLSRAQTKSIPPVARTPDPLGSTPLKAGYHPPSTPGPLSSAASPGLLGAAPSHLTNALQLADSVLKRYRRDRRSISGADLALLKQIVGEYSDLTGTSPGPETATAAAPAAATAIVPPVQTDLASRPSTVDTPTNAGGGGKPALSSFKGVVGGTGSAKGGSDGGPLSKPDDTPPTAGLAPLLARKDSRKQMFSKIREIIQAPKVYKEMIDAKHDVSSLTQFAVKCSSVSLSLQALCELLHHELSTMVGRSVAVLLRDGAYFVDVFSKTHVMQSDPAIAAAITAFENQSAKSVFVNRTIAVPLGAEQQMVGVVYIADVESEDSLGQLDMLVAASGIASLSMRTAATVETLVQENIRSVHLLSTAQNLAQDSLNERHLLSTVMSRATESADAETCILFLVDELSGSTSEGSQAGGSRGGHRPGSGTTGSQPGLKTVGSTTALTTSHTAKPGTPMTGGGNITGQPTRFRSVVCPDASIAGALSALDPKDIETAVALRVLQTGQTVRINDQSDLLKVLPTPAGGVERRSSVQSRRNMLCMPIRHEGVTVAVAQLVNKLPKSIAGVSVPRVFTEADENTFITFGTLAAISIRNSRSNQNALQEQRKTSAILKVVQLLSDVDIRDVTQVCRQIMAGAQKLLNADRASLFLVDKERDELYSTVAGGVGTGEIRFPMGKGIAGTVASTGIAENIDDAYSDDRFNKDIDKQLGYRTRSMLTLPISVKDEVIAVAQLVNKLDEAGNVQCFTAEDQEIFRAFALFAGMSLSNSHLLQFAIKAGQEAVELQSRISEEQVLMHRHRSSGFAGAVKVSIPKIDIDRVRTIDIPFDQCGDITKRTFNLWAIREHNPDTAKDIAAAVAVKVIQSSGLCETFDVDEDTLITFVLRCRAKYRNVPYHNFFHAVDALQTVYTFLYEGGAKKVLTELECFVLMFTALAHDLDHMGVNNSFHLKTDSPLGILSSASGNNSVLEVHHCNMAIEILQDPKSNVFSGISETELPKAYRAMIDCILATDMARHGELMGQFEALVKGQDGAAEFNQADEAHRRLVMKMILKAADISNVTKPFPISRLWAMSVTEEFYQQGDKEKAKGVAVLPQFDRSTGTELAKGQIGFISFLCKKYFQLLVTGPLAGLQFTVDQIESNLAEWQRLLSSAAPPPA